MTSAALFNLIDEPWIPVLEHTGGSVEVGLREVFARAGEIRSIGGDLPTQEFAIHRLLLAILRRALNWPDFEEDEVDQWLELWEADGLPVQVEQYLDAQHDQFYLLGGPRPFYQVADLEYLKPKKRPELYKLIADVPANRRVFSQRTEQSWVAMSASEAARWLVHAQAYDVAGIKGGVKGDPRVNKGKSYGMGVGWVGRLGGVLVESQDLRSSLLLNMAPASPTRAGGLDLPQWEKKTPLMPPQGEFPGPTPTGPLDVLTWQSRRIRLIHEGLDVTDVVITNGDRLAPQNRHGYESMSPWRRSASQEKELGGTVFMPATFSPDRSLWRGLESLLLDVPQSAGAGSQSERLPAATVNWLARLRDSAIPPDTRVTFRVFGFKYGTNDSVVEELLHDQLDIALSALDGPLAALAVEAAQQADQAVSALAQMAFDVHLASGGDPRNNASKTSARVAGFSDLDRPFRSWVVTLDSGVDRRQARAEWQGLVRHTIESLADSITADAPDAALFGRQVQGRGHVSSLAARQRLFRKLYRLLPEAFPTHGQEEAQ